ncbi:GATA zinc finger domain containing 2Ab isoform X4 [Denticeps clupeoides]|uniref:GATA-type domain-containing protein n=1 Tax=Denticeps clupeoides TaxID=299321 RepID=A0AAY4C9U4_9TELE|nr:transcriptional repressor p66-alpha isoform X4 [Denticeps clupeoides]
MSEEAGPQTRSQKRAQERDTAPAEADPKRLKLEKGDLVPLDGLKVKNEAVSKVNRILKAGEVKATIKVELQAGDEPVDMSTSKSDIKKECRPSSPDDVIVLSDNEASNPSSPCMNGLGNCIKKTDTDMLMKSCPEERERIIKQLKEELRLQEAKLVLLKKLRQSQVQKDSVVQKPANSVVTPPPLVRGSGTPSKGPLLSISVTPQQIQSLRHQQQVAHSASGPPPLLLAPRASVPNVQIQGQRIIQQGLIRVANTNVLVNIPQTSASLKGSSVTSQSGLSTISAASASDSPASRQAAAKLALRKQLEKTLLEIPPPKPPAPELNFLPSAANNEFIYLVGLEEVVHNLLDTLGRGKPNSGPKAPKDPFTCAQCKTDFTSRWRQEKSGTTMCEQCMTSNQKKALKAEHTTRLKAAFVKALQQEQEIEQSILQQTASPVSKSSSSSSSLSSPVVKTEQHLLVSAQYKQGHATSLTQHSQGTRAMPVNRHHGTIKQSPGQLSRTVQPVGVRGVSRNFTTSSQLQSAAAALVSRPGKHAVRAGAKVSSSSSSDPAARAWKKHNALTSGVTMAYVNPNLPVHKSSSAVDRQREYLLDMIPSRSISQTANTWK